MIKILFFIPGLSEGGAEKVLCNLVNNMDQKQFDITVQTINKFDYTKYLKEGIHYKSIININSSIGKKLFNYWYRLCAQLKLAYKFFIKDNYDIEVAYLECGATKVISQSNNKNAVKLAWVHCDLSKKEGMNTNINKIKKQYQKFDKVICVSKDVQKGFHKLYGNEIKTEVVYNIIDDEEILDKSNMPINFEKNENEIQLLAIGRLTLQKNFSYLIDSCAQLHKDKYVFHLNILGEGPERTNLEKQIIELNLEDIVTLRGFTDNPYPWIKESDLIVCSSKYEGISTVVQESFIIGKPIITTPCTGMKELLGDSKYGFIVENSKEGLYLGLKRLLDNQELLRKYTELSKARSIEFSKKKVIKETEELFMNEIMWRKT